jgi:hypothetical protein
MKNRLTEEQRTKLRASRDAGRAQRINRDRIQRRQTRPRTQDRPQSRTRAQDSPRPSGSR